MRKAEESFGELKTAKKLVRKLLLLQQFLPPQPYRDSGKVLLRRREMGSGEQDGAPGALPAAGLALGSLEMQGHGGTGPAAGTRGCWSVLQVALLLLLLSTPCPCCSHTGAMFCATKLNLSGHGASSSLPGTARSCLWLS